MAQEFRVDPDGLNSLAGDFRSAGEHLSGSIGGFTGQAWVIGEAFGMLGACSGVTAKYLEMVEQTGKGLEQLAEMLHSTSDALKHTSGQYAQADGGVMHTMGA